MTTATASWKSYSFTGHVLWKSAVPVLITSQEASKLLTLSLVTGADPSKACPVSNQNLGGSQWTGLVILCVHV